MRYAIVFTVLLSAIPAQAASRVIVVAPTSDANPAIAEASRKLPNMVTSGCGLTQAILDKPCSDFLCAAEAVINGEADVVFEAQVPPGEGDAAPIELTFSFGPRLALIGKATTSAAMLGDGVARVCQEAMSHARDRAPDIERKPLTEAEIATAMKDSSYEMYRCADRAWTGADKETAKGEPVLLDWVVRGDGSTTGVTLKSPAQKPQSTASECFSRTVSQLRFPMRGRAEVERGYKLVIDPSNPPQPKMSVDLQKTLTTDDISHGVKAHVEKLGPCVAAARSHKEIKAQRYVFVLDWKVLPSGLATDPKLVGPPEVLRTTLPACFEKVMREWRFRRTLEGATITNYPLPITPH